MGEDAGQNSIVLWPVFKPTEPVLEGTDRTDSVLNKCEPVLARKPDNRIQFSDIFFDLRGQGLRIATLLNRLRERPHLFLQEGE